jgi:monofunctional biosynthetic peptidoglycan transglycosylase
MKEGLVSAIHTWLHNLTAILIFCLFILPVALMLSLKWFNPPVSSYMVAFELSGNNNPVYYQWKDWDEISASAPRAIITAKDQLFSERSAIDFEQLKHAFDKFPQGSQVYGSSVITKQAVRNLFLWNDQSLISKGLESWLTVLMETSLDKKRILEIYLNIVEFTPGIYGIEAASQHFFYKPADKLTDNDAALLAAVLSKPEEFKVNSNSALVEDHQRWILDQMNTSDLSALLAKNNGSAVEAGLF